MFFARVYGMFHLLFGDEMWNYISGYDCTTLNYTGEPLCNTFGVVFLILSFLASLVYYIIIDHPAFSKWWMWLTYGVVISIIESMWVYWYVLDEWMKGNVGECLTIYQTNILGLSVSNALLFFIAFLIFSFCFKWGSKSCKYIPF